MPKATVKEGGPMAQYRRVYLVEPKEDVRKVQPRVAARLKQAGFEVIEVKADGPPIGSQGTGFVVGTAGEVLTCAHVVEKQTNATVWIEGKRYIGKITAVNTNLDAALIRLEGTNLIYPAIPFAPQLDYRMGQDAYTMGFPLADVLGVEPRLSKGMVSSTVGLADDTNQMQISVQIQPGNSGGPLLDEQGRALGMISSSLNPIAMLRVTGGSLPQNVNFAVKGGPLLKFLTESGVEPPKASAVEQPYSFEVAKRSVGLVRGGIVDDEDLKTPALLCAYAYLSMWDMWFRFKVFHIEFYDLKKGEWVLKAGQYGDNVFSTEDAVLDRTFAEICSKFFPQRPNPFSSGKSHKNPAPAAPSNT